LRFFIIGCKITHFLKHVLLYLSLQFLPISAKNTIFVLGLQMFFADKDGTDIC